MVDYNLKIGETFEIDGKKLRVEPAVDVCKYCFFDDDISTSEEFYEKCADEHYTKFMDKVKCQCNIFCDLGYIPECVGGFRDDEQNMIFVEVK